MGPIGSLAGGVGGALMGQGPGRQQYVPWQGVMPTRPDWESNLDPKTKLLDQKLTTSWGPDVTADQQGINAYRNMALGTGPSPWAQAQLEAQKLEEQGLSNTANQQNASQAAQARSSLASKYGLSSGANTSLAKQAMKNQMAAQQGVGFQGAQARAGIGAQDTSNRLQFLQGLPGQDLAQANLALQNKQGNLGQQQFNIQNAINEQNAKRAADLQNYHEQMSVFGANKNADAMRQQSAGGKK